MVGFYSVYQIFSKKMLGTKTKSIGPLVLHWDLRKLLVPHSLHEVLANDWVSTHVSNQKHAKITITMPQKKKSKFMGLSQFSQESTSLFQVLCACRTRKMYLQSLLLSKPSLGVWCSKNGWNFTTISQVQHVFFMLFLKIPCSSFASTPTNSWRSFSGWGKHTRHKTVLDGIISDKNLWLFFLEIGSWVTFLSLADARLGSIPPPDKQAQLETPLATYLDVACTAQPDSKRGIRRTGDSPGSTG